MPGGILPYIGDTGTCDQTGFFFGNIFHKEGIYFKGDCYRLINRVQKFPAYHKQGMEIHSNFIDRVRKFPAYHIQGMEIHRNFINRV